MQHLFVYGTLAPNQPNAHILAPINGTWRPATIRGKLYPRGWGATLGFPAVIPSKEGDIVNGLVFSSEELEKHWQRIDDFEGEGYTRTEVEATLLNEQKNGETLTVFVYSLDPKELN